MTDVAIEYCVPRGFRDRAVDVQGTLLDVYGERLDRVAPVTGDGGVFRVYADGDLVFDKGTDEYDLDAIVEAVGDRVGVTA